MLLSRGRRVCVHTARLSILRRWSEFAVNNVGNCVLRLGIVGRSIRQAQVILPPFTKYTYVYIHHIKDNKIKDKTGEQNNDNHKK